VRRIYMSATIADDSEIVRTFGASREAVATPITSASLAGVGERMILVPELMKLAREAITPLVKSIAVWIAQNKGGAAILAPSGPVAKTWSDVAIYPETTRAVSVRVAAMQNGSFHGPLVLANRYDGIDLAGGACRLLVLDGLPQGASDYDMYRVNVIADSAVNSLLAQRIEQGIGRGTRGAGDYWVVVLIGSRLVGWIGRKNNLTHLTASTRVQLKMGQEVSEAVTTRNEVGQTMLKCLNRDPDWVAYHASELADAAHSAPVDLLALRIAGVERYAFQLQRLGQFEPAIQALEKLIDDEELARDAQRRAWISALAARIAYQMGNERRAQQLQSSAFSVNNNLSPPKVRPAYFARPAPGKQSTAIVARLLEYERRGALLAHFDEAIVELVPEASPGRFEEALANLGAYIGFEAERPENAHRVGPDVLWRTDAAFDFVIEAKSKKDEENPLYKRDHAQLLEAEQWFKEAYRGRQAIRVSALPEAVADAKATPVGTFALRLTEITKLVSALRALLSELVVSPGTPDILREQCEEGLVKAGLKPDGIKASFLTAFGKAATIKA
jgi:replicative superfamily II helicase